MLSVPKPSFRQIWVALGMPGNGVVVQSANAQSVDGIVTRGSVSLVRLVKTASRLSRLAVGKLVCVSPVNEPLLRFCVEAAAVTTYFTVSVLFWYVGLIPDLAVMRDRAKTQIRKFLYGLFALGWTIIAVALRTNPFAVTVVRLQNERQHTVVDTGIYSVVRHPMYAGNPAVNVGLSLWLGSYAAVVFAAIPLGLLMVRIGLEERFLRRELPGYREYVSRVPYRLLPGLW